MSLFRIGKPYVLEDALRECLLDAHQTCKNPRPYKFHVPHLQAYFGAGRALGTITWQDVEAYQLQACESGNWTRGTIRHQLALLSRCYRLAIRAGRVNENPVSKIKWLKKGDSRRVWVRQDQIPELFDQLTRLDRNIVTSYCYTGLRRMELFGMRRCDVQWAAREIDIPVAKGDRPRTITMHPGMPSVLQWLEGQHKGPFVIPGDHPNREAVAENFRRRFKTGLKKIGLEHVRVHDLRRTCASWLLEAGASLSVIRDLLGHASIVTTEIYARTAAHSMRSAVASVPWIGYGLEEA